MKKRQDGITIYPDKALRNKLEKEAEKQKRSLNNFILFILSSHKGKHQRDCKIILL